MPSSHRGIGCRVFKPMNNSVLILRACDFIDFDVLPHESNQALTTRQNTKGRIKSQTLRSALLRASRRMAIDTAEQAAILRDAPPRGGAPQDEVFDFCAGSQSRCRAVLKTAL